MYASNLLKLLLLLLLFIVSNINAINDKLNEKWKDKILYIPS